MHAQTTTLPFFLKKRLLLLVKSKSFITIQLLSFSYMSQVGFFFNFSFIWSNLQKKQKWPFRSWRQCTLFYWNPALTVCDNSTIFISVQEYIKDIGRLKQRTVDIHLIACLIYYVIQNCISIFLSLSLI